MSSGPDLFVVCKSCGSEVSPYITECPYCGNRLRKRAPKLERDGTVKDRKLRRAERRHESRRETTPRLGRLRAGEMPGIRMDGGGRPNVTIALVLASMLLTGAWRAGGLSLGDVAIVGKLAGEPWRLVTSIFPYDNAGYAFVALTIVALFGWLLERRHGFWAPALVFLAGGVVGMGLAVLTQSYPVALGGNGAALALLAAWAVPDLRARRAGEDTDSDLLGTAVLAAVLLLMPAFVASADPIAGAGGAVTGLLLGRALSLLGSR